MRHRSSSRALLVLFSLATLALIACGPHAVPDRLPGDRSPLSARCDSLDETRCLLPWPSSTYTIVDATSPTTLRIALAKEALPVVDDPAPLNRDDGFSVVTPLAVGFDRPIAGAAGRVLDGERQTSAVRLLLAQPGPTRGEAVPLRLAIFPDSRSADQLLVAYPMRPLAYDSDYVAVVLDEVRGADGAPLPVPRAVQVALGRADPTSDDEAALLAYHAPTRALLAQTNIDPARVLRVWDFSTRSATSVADPLRAMRQQAIAAVTSGATTVTIDRAALLDGDRGLELRGTLAGLPDFVSTGRLVRDASGLPVASGTGTRAAKFRALIPTGLPSTQYPMVLFGHGTGGSVNDGTFDDEIIAAGAGKLNVEWTGWAGTDALNTFLTFDLALTGTEASTGKLMQALAEAGALEAALDDGGPLRAVLALATITPTSGAPVANPAAGRSPDLGTLIYAGGSLGGTLGYVHALVDDRVKAAVLNVPGAGWTHFVPPSLFWSQLRPLFSTASDLDLALGLVMTQNGWDPIDGGAWSSVGSVGSVGSMGGMAGMAPRPFLIQESMGDPVLPNIGTELVATSSGAVQVAAVLQPILGVLPVAESSATAITQFRVPAATSIADTHGFATENKPAGRAARAQIAAFFASVWAGAARISVPDACAAQGGSCDFSAE